MQDCTFGRLSACCWLLFRRKIADVAERRLRLLVRKRRPITAA